MRIRECNLKVKEGECGEKEISESMASGGVKSGDDEDGIDDVLPTNESTPEPEESTPEPDDPTPESDGSTPELDEPASELVSSAGSNSNPDRLPEPQYNTLGLPFEIRVDDFDLSSSSLQFRIEAYAIIDVGVRLMQMNEAEEAVVPLSEAVRMCASADSADSFVEAIALFKLADAYTKIADRKSAAAPLFEAAATLFQTFNVVSGQNHALRAAYIIFPRRRCTFGCIALLAAAPR